MKTHAQAVIIGGGVAGCSIAYHLTLLGWRDVVLVEKGELTSGSTFHSAGLVGQLRSSASLTRMMVYSADLYGRLKDETGHDPSFHQVGSLRLASSKPRMDEHTLHHVHESPRSMTVPLMILAAGVLVMPERHALACHDRRHALRRNQQREQEQRECTNKS